jgi:hypothetical protein
MDNILVESIRHSHEMSFNAGDSNNLKNSLATDVKKGRNPMLARSFEMGVKHNAGMYMMSEPNDNVKFNMDLTGSNMNQGLESALKNSAAIDPSTFGDKKGASMFYEPNISKPIRSHKDVTIVLSDKGKLQGMPTAWREALEM